LKLSASLAPANRVLGPVDEDPVAARLTLLDEPLAALDARTRAMLNGEMPRLFTDERRCPIWVGNLCEVLVELAESDYQGVLHVAGAQPLNRYEFGVKLVTALGGDASRLIPMRASDSRMTRPLDCTLDISRARKLLKTKLLGVDDVIGRR